MKQKPSKKTLIFASILLLLSCILILALAKALTLSDVHTLTYLNSSITPTPYSLPTQVYGPPQSIFTTILGQIFRKGNQSIDPIRIIEDGQRVAENPYIDLYVENNYRPVDIEWWQQESKSVYEYVSERFNTALSDKVIVTFVPSKTGNCAPRGTTFHEQQSIIVIFASKDTSKEQILATLAHELGHVFIHKKYENLTDLALTEGLATWSAGDYWKAWKGFGFNSSVKTYVNTGTYLPLFSNYDMKLAYDDNSSECITHRDILLTEIASFIDYLSQNYGAEKLSKLLDMKQPELVNNQRVVYPPNFKDAFGLELNQLEYIWLKTLVQPSQ
jgi:hypothetical protein